MPSHHRSHPILGLVAHSGAPGGGPSFEKPAAPQPAAPAGPPYGGQPQPYGHPQPGGAALLQGGGGTFELSGWWRRVGAQLVDGLILTIPYLALSTILGAVFGIGFSGDDDPSAGGIIAALVTFMVVFGIYIVLVFAYAPYFMAKWNGATPGKRALGIRVVRADGLPMNGSTAIMREVVVKFLLFGVGSFFTVGILWLVNYLWPLWDSEHRALHDMVVNTRVVRA